MLVDAPSRGVDWVNATAYLGVTLAYPVVATVVALLLDVVAGPQLIEDSVERDGWQLVVAWLPFWLWLLLAPYATWWRWQGRVEASTLHVTPDGIAGRTCGPVRSFRSVRLDHLSSVRYHRRFWPQRHLRVTADDYLAVSDTMGGRIAVKFRRVGVAADRAEDVHPELCRALREALDRSPYAKANDLTRRRLNGVRSRWVISLGASLSFLLVMLTCAVALPVTAVTLYWLGAFDGVLPEGWPGGVGGGG